MQSEILCSINEKIMQIRLALCSCQLNVRHQTTETKNNIQIHMYYVTCLSIPFTCRFSTRTTRDKEQRNIKLKNGSIKILSQFFKDIFLCYVS